MVRATTILQMGRKTLQDTNLLKALQSEINHEASTNRFKNDKTEPLGDFVVDWDSPQSQDVVLRKKFESGEELAVSALLGEESEYDSENGIDFAIHNAKYLQSATNLGSSLYRGPLFSTVDPLLQYELEQYLVRKGIGKDLINFLTLHLHKKEQGQYENWLNMLKDIIGKKE